MASACWQDYAAEEVSKIAVRLPFKTAKKFFAVDCSGSTSGAIMRAQHKFVKGLHGNAEDQVTKWDNFCREPGLVDGMPDAYYDGSGGTSPESIAQNGTVVKTIKNSELWILLTDGVVSANQVNELATRAERMDFIQVPVVFLITGGRYSSPGDTNISVGVPFFANSQEALILFKDYTTGQIFIIDAKGAFEPLKATRTEPKPKHWWQKTSSTWDTLPVYKDEVAFCVACTELGIDLELHTGLQARKSVSLGPRWASSTGNALVNVPKLLEQAQITIPDLQHLLDEEAISHLALICKLRGLIAGLRDLLLRHKQKEVVLRLEDRHGASKIMGRMQGAVDPAEKAILITQLREAHALNRDTYRRLKDSPSDEARLAAELNRSINRALALLSDFEKSAYTADILNRKSNRAMRAGVVSAADTEVYATALDLSDATDACRGACPICCGEDQIMSIVLKRLETVEENTTDFALNFPLAAGWSQHNKDMISSQCICFQCALLLDRSIFQEDVVAKIPAVSYHGPNRKYIEHQLYLALTAGLSTGASGIVQLFSTILDRTLETKSWCSKSNVADPEVAVRRKVLSWVLLDLLHKCSCREDFAETGRWVPYPEALTWATKDYGISRLDSWIIQYPLTGFNQLLQWYSLLEIPVDVPLEIIKKAKLIHFLTATIMNGLRDKTEGDTLWTQPFLSLIYRGFNAPGVPCNLGQSSLVLPDLFWIKFETFPGASQDVKRFLKQFTLLERHQVVSRIQIVIFWALFKQKSHAMPKTFFRNIATLEPLAQQVLDPQAPMTDDAIHGVLMSIFLPDRKIDIHHGGPSDPQPPFVSPYGPSILECGYPSCDVKFYDTPRRSDVLDPRSVRERRAQHLREVFAVGSFNSQTGLPEPTKAPKAPSSSHVTMHISIARIWAALPLDQKRALLTEVAAQLPAPNDSKGPQSAISDFIGAVRLQLCAQSRRGDIYSSLLEDQIRQLLPSFLESLRVAGRNMDLSDPMGLNFVHDWTQNTIVWKMEYELNL